MPAQNLKDFKILAEDNLMKLSLDQLNAYYTQLDQWEQEKAAAEKKKRDQARSRLVDRKTQEKRHLDREKPVQRMTKDSEKETAFRRVHFGDEVGRSVQSPERKKNSDIDQSSGIDPRVVFSCVEVPASARSSENHTPNSSHGPRPSSSFPDWRNDGKPLPYVAEMEPGIAYPATAKSPNIYYLGDRSGLFSAQDIAVDKAKARKYPNNPIHKYTVAKDGCIYHNSTSWKPSRERCMKCVKDNLHCWRRVASNGHRCLRCSYRKGKCQDVTEDQSESSQEEDNVVGAPSPTQKNTEKTRGIKRKRVQADSEDEGESVQRSRGRPEIVKETDVASEDCLPIGLSTLKDLTKEIIRHRGAVESIYEKTMEEVCTQNKKAQKADARK